MKRDLIIAWLILAAACMGLLAAGAMDADARSVPTTYTELAKGNYCFWSEHGPVTEYPFMAGYVTVDCPARSRVQFCLSSSPDQRRWTHRTCQHIMVRGQTQYQLLERCRGRRLTWWRIVGRLEQGTRASWPLRLRCG